MNNKKTIILTIIIVFIAGLILSNKFWFGEATKDIGDNVISYRLTSVLIIVALIFIAIYLTNKRKDSNATK